LQTMDTVALALCAGSGFRVGRTRSEIARTSAHSYVACVHLDGDASVRNGGSEKALRTGDVFLLDTMHEFALGLERPFRQLVVKLPKELIEARIARPDLLAGSVLPYDNPLTRMLVGYLAVGLETAERISPTARAMFAQHLLDLFSEAVSEVEATETLSKARRAALFAFARRLISLKFNSPDLRPEQIARALGISTRTLHRVFAEHGETVMKAIMAERVDRAAKLLAAPEARDRTVTDIAFACGFNDVSHFGRVFEARVSSTPSQWRRQFG
jgi:AraC family transcriptional regulator, positive regulator of tynA and feaB